MKKIPIIYSTITGNAFKLADAIKENVEAYLGPYNIRYINDEVINKFDTFVLVYWCNHGTADDDTIALINRMQNKNIMILGTLGAAVESDHAKKVYENASNLVLKNNNLIGNFLCRGSIDLNRTAKRMEIPEGQKGHLSKERFEKQKESINHPNELDFENARKVLKEAFLRWNK